MIYAKLYPFKFATSVYMASLIAVGASDNPMTITIGPTTIGGKTLSIQPLPANFTIKATIR